MSILHGILAQTDSFEDTNKRFESLRGCALLPIGRENAAKRLSNLEIASALLGFAPKAPAFAGFASLALGDLRPVGGPQASFKGAKTLMESIASILSDDDFCEAVVALTLSINRDYNSEEYNAKLIFEDKKCRKTVSYVCKMAVSLLSPGAEAKYDYEMMNFIFARQINFGKELFKKIRRDVEISRALNRPLETDWREYESKEKLDAFHTRLGARQNSIFLNIAVDTQVTWLQEPTRIDFSGHHFVLYPRTREHTQSISIDLTAERLSAEDARTLLNRFLSLLSWCDDQYAILGDGWSGNPVPVAVPRSNKGQTLSSQWLFYRTIPEDDEVRQRLAYFREGLNAREAGLATFAVVSFFKVFERRTKSKRGETNATIKWLQSAFPTIEKSLPSDTVSRFHTHRGDIPVEKYIYENCRVAAAHASEQVPSDADSSLEIQRLYSATEVIHALARHYLEVEKGLSRSRLSD